MGGMTTYLVRIAAVALASTVAIIAGAVAQPRQNVVPAEPSSIVPAWGSFDPRIAFDARPNGRDFARLYPRKAWRRSVTGAVTLCCKPKSDRTLQCRAAAEWPDASWGFGEASVEIGSIFSVNPETFDIVRAYPDAELRVPIRWAIEPAAAGSSEAMAEASAIMSRAILCRGETRRAPTS